MVEAKRLVRLKSTPEMREKIMRSIDWSRVDAMTEDEIEADLARDPDAALPLTEAEGKAIWLQGTRKRMGLSQTQFAERFHIPIGTLRDWEQARREPEGAAWAYLLVIAYETEAVVRALKDWPGP